MLFKLNSKYEILKSNKDLEEALLEKKSSDSYLETNLLKNDLIGRAIVQNKNIYDIDGNLLKDYRSQVSLKDYKDNFCVEALINIYNQVIFKRALTLKKREEFEDKNSRTGRSINGKIKEEYKSLFYNDKNKQILEATLKKSLMLFIEEYVKKDFIPLFLTQTLNSDYNITEEYILQNNDISLKLKEQDKIFTEYNSKLFKKINDTLRKAKLPLCERISVNETTKRLNIHHHHIYLIHKDSLSRSMRSMFNFWENNSDIGRTQMEPILEVKLFNNTMKSLTKHTQNKKLLFNIKVFDKGNTVVCAEKEEGNRFFYTLPQKEVENLQFVGNYIFKYLTKNMESHTIPAGEELYSKKIHNSITQRFSSYENLCSFTNDIMKNYTSSFWEARLHLLEDIHELFENIENLEDIDIKGLINDFFEYSYDNVENIEGSMYLALQGLDYIETTNVLKKDKILGLMFYICKMIENGDISKDKNGLKINNYLKPNKQKSKTIEYKDFGTRELLLIDEKSGISEVKSLKDQNIKNIYVNDYANPYLKEIGNTGIHTLRQLPTFSDELENNYHKATMILDNVDMSNIKGFEGFNCTSIEAVDYIHKDRDLSIFKQNEVDLNKTISSQIIDRFNDLELIELVREISNEYKDNKGFVEINFLTYTNKDRQLINKLFQKEINTNDSIDFGFKLFDRIIYTENKLKHFGITKLDIFTIVKSIDNYIFLRNKNNKIGIYPNSILSQGFELAAAITIHQSQGQSLNNVVVVQREPQGFDMSLFYVACSRARNNLITLLSQDVLNILEKISGKIKEGSNGSIFQSKNYKYQDIKDIKVLDNSKIIPYTGWFGKTIHTQKNIDIKLNNYLISEFKYNQTFGVSKKELLKLGFEIPSSYDQQEIISAVGIKEHYEEVLQSLNNKINITTNYKLLKDISSLNKEQRDFVNVALKSGLTILTGEGGSGKTYTLNKLYENLISNGLDKKDICFTAFTNSACGVLKDNIIEAQVKTIHTLADIGTNGIGYSNNKQHFEYVIIDEVSMTDFRLLNELLKCLSPETRIILVGDNFQLPPVAGVSILEDIIQIKPTQHIQLIKNHRVNNNELKELNTYLREII